MNKKYSHAIMVKPLLQDSYGQATENDLLQLERSIGIRFPQAYRSFLLQTNGGDFPSDVVIVSDDRTSRVALRSLFGVHTGDAYDIGWRYETCSSRLPEGFLPIADDPGGNEICIAAIGRDAESIWWIDHELPVGCSWPPENGERLADSFEQFMNLLEYPSPSEAHWKETIPAFMSAERGDASVLDSILSDGFGVNTGNEQGMSLLSCAAAARQSQIVRLLIERGAIIDARDSKGRTPLHWAAQHFSLDSAKLLVAAGGDLDAADANGDTPLLIGVRFGYRVPLFLTQSGANVNARNNLGQTPLTLCQDFSDQLRGLLIGKGAGA